MKGTCIKMRTKSGIIAGLLAVGLVMAVAAPATAASTESTPAPSSAPVIKLVPATDNDLPKGHVTIGPSVSGGATSATVTPDASWVCSIFASDPADYGVDVAGTGWQSCTGSGYQPQRVIVQVQKEVALFFWENAGSASTGWSNSDWEEDTAYATCSSGTYRIVTTGYADAGAYNSEVQSLNYLSVTC
jgi:hypothetical protein